MNQRTCFTTIVLTAIGWLIQVGEISAQTRRATFPKEAIEAAKGFTLAPGMEASLFAAEPMLANPVAFSIDEKGRVFVCETYRQEKGVEDNRDHEVWITDDLASQTVEDRLNLYKKHLDQGVKDYSKHQDRIRMLADRDGNGQADIATVYVDGFDDPLEGTGAGVLAHNGYVYYSCIPKLWAFGDSDDDGKADRRGVLSEGYGVRVAFRGHDLHGLNVGPDGRLYFTIGDRGMNVKTDDGRIKSTETGAVLRCELSGADLELYATGLRNPQDLAFDDYGNLFTCDNNSDNGDKARWLHILDGADYGWRMAFQYMGKNSPWHRERMWEPYHSQQPAFMMPPVANIADGPSGIAHYPGTGLPISYRGNFFLCDFRGTAEFSGVWTFKVKPRGATFDLIDPELFLWKCLATDVQFGVDGKLYVSDWVDGWVGTGKGRIYQAFHPETLAKKVVGEVKQLMVADLTKVKEPQLQRLMAHPDRRIRLRGQFELARRRDVQSLAQVAHTSKIQLAKLHGVWGLGQIGRSRHKAASQALQELAALMRDTDPDVRASSAKMLGEAGYQAGLRRLIDGLRDSNPRVSRECAIALSKLADRQAIRPLIDLIAANNDSDPALRHAGVMGLVGCASELQLAELSSHESAAVRLAAVVGLRRLGSAKVTKFLSDDTPFIVEETARAIYDTPIEAAYPELAKLVLSENVNDVVLTRAANACLRVGTQQHAEALVELAQDESKPSLSRIEAMEMLGRWTRPPDRDRIVGMWRPVKSERSDTAVAEALQGEIFELLQGNHEIRTRAARLAGELNMTEAIDKLDELLWDEQRDGKERAGALLALGDLKPEGFDQTLEKSLQASEERVRAAARILMTRSDPATALPELKNAIAKGSQLEKQSALFMLSNIDTAQADKLLLSILRALVADKVYPAVRLDIIEAARKRETANPLIKELSDQYVASWDNQDVLAPYRDALEGGDASRGEMLYKQRVSLQCVRCHVVDGDGGQVGPDLSKIGAAKTREELLESIVEPNKTIAKGYETMVLELDSGKIVTGIVHKKTKESVVLRTSDGELITVELDSIEDSRKGNSSMPDNLIDQLSSFDLRDLIEYLSQLK